MVEFTLQIEESVVRSFGHAYIEQYLQSVVKKMVLKAAAQDVLEDWASLDLNTDHDWQAARRLAWEQEHHKYLTAE
jgi:citrate lyase gamma subunit